MIGNKQEQSSGDASVNIQGRDVVVVSQSGLSYTEARQLAMDVFEANFHRLSTVAMAVARERAEEFLDSFLGELKKSGSSDVLEAENPDFQYALLTAQREYARSGNAELESLLVQLLVDRSKQPQGNLEQIVLTESLNVAPKLTPDQLDALSIVFTVRYSMHPWLGNLADLKSFLERFIKPFAPGLPEKVSAFQHLEFASCGAISLGHADLAGLFVAHYRGLLVTGFSEDELRSAGVDQASVSQLLMPCLHNKSLLQVAALNDSACDKKCRESGIGADLCSTLKNLQNTKTMNPTQIREYLTSLVPETALLFAKWDATPLKNMTLTSVGIAIAAATVTRATGHKFQLSNWI